MWRGVFFFFNDTATTEIYTLSLHDALPISHPLSACKAYGTISTRWHSSFRRTMRSGVWRDRKSTRLNSSHVAISYAVFCLKKKKNYEYAILIEKKKKQKQNRC